MKNANHFLIAAVLLTSSGAVLAQNNDECDTFFTGKTVDDKEVNLCGKGENITLKIGYPNSKPEVNIQAKQKDVLADEATGIIDDQDIFVYSLFIPSKDKWYGVSFGRHHSVGYSVSIGSGVELNKTNIYKDISIEDQHFMVNESVSAKITFSKFTKIERPTNEKDYNSYLQSLYTLATFTKSK